jgi:IclR family KDG regulon transcriptional repressor
MGLLDKALFIINHLRTKDSASLQEISDASGIPKSTAHRLLKEMRDYGFISKSLETKRYSLGIAFIQIGLGLLEKLDLKKVATPYLDQLNSETLETVHLAMLIDDQIIYIDKRESKQAIRMYSYIGKSAPVYCTGVGKALISFQEPDIRARIVRKIEFKKFTKTTMSTPEELQRAIGAIREAGFAVDNEEHEDNIICIAAPIFNHKNVAVASLSITTMTYRISLDELIKYKVSLIAICQEISMKLGWNGNGKNANH